MMKLSLPERFSPQRSAIALICVLLATALSSAAFADSLTDFFSAIKKDDSTIISSLLRRGLSPNLVEGDRGDTGLMLALRDDSKKVFDVLLNAPSIDLEVRARNGDTALMIAAIKGNVGAVKALIAKEAEVNRPGWTALHYAASIGNDDIVKILLDESAYIDAESTNGTTPLMMAARGGHLSTVKLLIDEGADATIKNYNGVTALDFARNSDVLRVIDDMTALIKKASNP